MANIAPNTNVYICTGIPIDNSYNHSLYFANATAQHAYFQSKVTNTFLANTYQRVGRNKIRLAVLADNIITCNYMMFQNTAFGNKWFYAFINGVEYINNATTEITYEIDVLQTWMFDYTLGRCYVLREHPTTDAIGENIVPEPIEPGEYVTNSWHTLVDLNDQYICVLIGRATTGSGDTATVNGTILNNIFSGCTMYAYDDRDWTSVLRLIEKYVNTPDEIVAIYMCPRNLMGGATFSDTSDASDIPHNYNGGRVTTYTVAQKTTSAIPRPTSYEPIHTYQIKNNKLHTYPYTALNVAVPNGQSMTLRYEWFLNGTGNINFIYGGSILCPVEANFYPYGYKNSATNGGGGVYGAQIGESIGIGNLPMCSWVSDYYTAWETLNAYPAVARAVGSIGGGAIGGMLSSGSVMGATGSIGGILSAMGNWLGNSWQAAYHADNTKGNVYSGNALYATGLFGVYWTRLTPSRDRVALIDHFFTRYGYAVNELKIPTINNRPHWTYVKTDGCILTGNISSDDEHKIIEIFDNGITWWRNPSEVGHFELDNRPA